MIQIDFSLRLKILNEKKFFFLFLFKKCCSAHRRHDPYNHIVSKVKSFENFSHEPLHPAFQVSTFK